MIINNTIINKVRVRMQPGREVRVLEYQVRVLRVTTGKCECSTSQNDPDPRLGTTNAPEWVN